MLGRGRVFAGSAALLCSRNSLPPEGWRGGVSEASLRRWWGSRGGWEAGRLHCGSSPGSPAPAAARRRCGARSRRSPHRSGGRGRGGPEGWPRGTRAGLPAAGLERTPGSQHPQPQFRVGFPGCRNSDRLQPRGKHQPPLAWSRRPQLRRAVTVRLGLPKGRGRSRDPPCSIPCGYLSSYLVSSQRRVRGALDRSHGLPRPRHLSTSDLPRRFHVPFSFFLLQPSKQVCSLSQHSSRERDRET